MGGTVIAAATVAERHRDALTDVGRADVGTADVRGADLGERDVGGTDVGRKAREGSLGNRRVFAMPVITLPGSADLIRTAQQSASAPGEGHSRKPTTFPVAGLRYRPYPEPGREAPPANLGEGPVRAGATGAPVDPQPSAPSRASHSSDRNAANPSAASELHLRAVFESKPYNFDWTSVYCEICVYREKARLRGDTYAERAGREATTLIQSTLSEVGRNIGVVPGETEPQSLYRALRFRMQAAGSAEKGGSSSSLRTAEDLIKALRKIDSLTHRMACNLALRAREFAEMSQGALPSAPPTKGVTPSLCEVNRNTPCPGLRPAEAGPVDLESCSQSPQDWPVDFDRLITLWEHYRTSGNKIAFHLCDSALDSIARKLTEAYRCIRPEPSDLDFAELQRAYRELRLVRARHNSPLWSHRTRASITGRLNAIADLTHKKVIEMEARSAEFAALSPRARPRSPTTVQDTEALDFWLRDQADTAAYDAKRADDRKDATEKAAALEMIMYFMKVRQDHAIGRDPWTASRDWILSRHPKKRARAAPPMLEAHFRLVCVMVGQMSQSRNTGPPPLHADHPAIPDKDRLCQPA